MSRALAGLAARGGAGRCAAQFWRLAHFVASAAQGLADSLLLAAEQANDSGPAPAHSARLVPLAEGCLSAEPLPPRVPSDLQTSTLQRCAGVAPPITLSPLYGYGCFRGNVRFGKGDFRFLGTIFS